MKQQLIGISIFILTATSLFASKHDDRNIFFHKDSFNLNEKAISELKGYYEYVNKGINSKLFIVITPWCCFDEIKKNPMLGLMRAKAIIDFYEKNYKIERTSFLIKDELHLNDSFWESFCGENPFVTFDASIPMYMRK
ncbi:MAG: hypothetical protein Q7W13_09325 [Bacteroidia bacterium]|nr:hypothetical protein [Bacteroidia bacterium]